MVGGYADTTPSPRAVPRQIASPQLCGDPGGEPVPHSYPTSYSIPSLSLPPLPQTQKRWWHMDLESLLVSLYVLVDDWWQRTHPPAPRKPGRPPSLSTSEVLTLAVLSQWPRWGQ
jgi:hypothetical protein